VFDDLLRARLEDELDADLFNMYAAHEFAQIAMECRTHEGLHLQGDYLILESLEDGKAVGFGRQGVAVLTSLYSFAMPFIRYNLGDLVVLREQECSCGSAFPLLDHPVGRVNELLTLPSGTTLSPQGFVHVLRDFPGIDQWRVIQETPSRFILKLAMPLKPGEEFVSNMRTEILAYLGENVTVDIERVSHIEEERLKFRHFISKIVP
jgi:phenylacetate-CoA ligase